MKKIYIDSDFRCHISNIDGTLREIETDAFDGKCDYLISGYRFIPEGESWTRSDGEVFEGEMVAPAEDYEPLSIAQAQYDADHVLMEDMETALDILLGGSL